MIDVKSVNQSPYDRYAYVIRHPQWMRLLYLFGIISWLGSVYGFVIFFNLSIWYWIIFAPIIGIFSLYYLLSYGINLFYSGFSLRKHWKFKFNYWQKRKRFPSIDIFIPVCGENKEIVEKTLLAAKNISYPDKKIYILDDKGEQEIKLLVSKLELIYLSRPNKGEMKKAGNLKYGFEHSSGDFIIIFDADFVADPDFIKELLPYMEDQKVAIVQSPQYFAASEGPQKKSALEYGAAYVQEDFYRLIQPARDYFDGAICVGTNAIYRRSALKKIDGTYQISHSEDVHTGFALNSLNYKVKYIPLILAQGLCPDNLYSYFNQQHRWCDGSMNLFLSGMIFRAKISLSQKLCFFSGVLYYLTSICSLLLSFQIFILLIFHYDYISLKHTLPFLPYLFFSFILLPLTRYTKPKFGTYFAYIAYTHSYAHSVISSIFKKPMTWTSTNGKKAGLSHNFYQLFLFNSLYLLVYILLTSYLIVIGRFPFANINYYSVMIWIYYNTILHVVLFYFCYQLISEVKKKEMDTNQNYQKSYNTWRYATLGCIVLVSAIYSFSHFYRVFGNPQVQIAVFALYQKTLSSVTGVLSQLSQSALAVGK